MKFTLLLAILSSLVYLDDNDIVSFPVPEGDVPEITPEGCEYICFNTDVQLVTGEILPSEVLVGTVVEFYLRMGTNNGIVLLCCDNFYAEYSIEMPTGNIITGTHEELWGFEYYYDPEGWPNAPQAYIPVGHWIANPNDATVDCWVLTTAITTQISTGSPYFEWTDGDVDWIRVVNPDLNGDQIVNTIDLLMVITNWGEGPSDGDTNCDEVTNSTDLLYILTNWGKEIIFE